MHASFSPSSFTSRRTNATQPELRANARPAKKQNIIGAGLVADAYVAHKYQQQIRAITRNLHQGVADLEEGRVFWPRDDDENEPEELEWRRATTPEGLPLASADTPSASEEVLTIMQRARATRKAKSLLPAWLKGVEVDEEDMEEDDEIAEKGEDTQDASAATDQVASMYESDGFLNFGQRDIEDGIDDYASLRLKGLEAQLKTEDLIQKFHVQERIDLLKEVHQWYQDHYAHAGVAVEVLTEQEEFRDRLQRELDASQAQLREALANKEMKFLLRANGFLETMDNYAPRRVKSRRASLNATHEDKSGGKDADSDQTRSAILSEKLKDLRDEVAHAKQQVESETNKAERATELLRIISQQQDTIATMTNKIAVTKQRIDAIEQCIILVQAESARKAKNKAATQRGRRASREREAAYSEAVMNMLAEARKKVNATMLADHLKNDPELFYKLSVDSAHDDSQEQDTLKEHAKSRKSLDQLGETKQRKSIFSLIAVDEELSPEDEDLKVSLNDECQDLKEEIEHFERLQAEGILDGDITSIVQRYDGMIEPPTPGAGDEEGGTASVAKRGQSLVHAVGTLVDKAGDQASADTDEQASALSAQATDQRHHQSTLEDGSHVMDDLALQTDDVHLLVGNAKKVLTFLNQQKTKIREKIQELKQNEGGEEGGAIDTSGSLKDRGREASVAHGAKKHERGTSEDTGAASGSASSSRTSKGEPRRKTLKGSGPLGRRDISNSPAPLLPKLEDGGAPASETRENRALLTVPGSVPRSKMSSDRSIYGGDSSVGRPASKSRSPSSRSRSPAPPDPFVPHDFGANDAEKAYEGRDSLRGSKETRSSSNEGSRHGSTTFTAPMDLDRPVIFEEGMTATDEILEMLRDENEGLLREKRELEAQIKEQQIRTARATKASKVAAAKRQSSKEESQADSEEQEHSQDERLRIEARIQEVDQLDAAQSLRQDDLDSRRGPAEQESHTEGRSSTVESARQGRSTERGSYKVASRRSSRDEQRGDTGDLKEKDKASMEEQQKTNEMLEREIEVWEQRVALLKTQAPLPTDGTEMSEDHASGVVADAALQMPGTDAAPSNELTGGAGAAEASGNADAKKEPSMWKKVRQRLTTDKIAALMAKLPKEEKELLTKWQEHIQELTGIQDDITKVEKEMHAMDQHIKAAKSGANTDSLLNSLKKQDVAHEKAHNPNMELWREVAKRQNALKKMRKEYWELKQTGAVHTDMGVTNTHVQQQQAEQSDSKARGRTSVHTRPSAWFGLIQEAITKHRASVQADGSGSLFIGNSDHFAGLASIPPVRGGSFLHGPAASSLTTSSIDGPFATRNRFSGSGTNRRQSRLQAFVSKLRSGRNAVAAFNELLPGAEAQPATMFGAFGSQRRQIEPRVAGLSPTAASAAAASRPSLRKLDLNSVIALGRFQQAKARARQAPALALSPTARRVLSMKALDLRTIISQGRGIAAAHTSPL